MPKNEWLERLQELGRRYRYWIETDPEALRCVEGAWPASDEGRCAQVEMWAAALEQKYGSLPAPVYTQDDYQVEGVELEKLKVADCVPEYVRRATVIRTTITFPDGRVEQRLKYKYAPPGGFALS